MSQLSLFKPETKSTPRRPPDLNYIRRSLNRLLRILRDAQIMPWSEAEAQSWEKLVPQLAAYLPPEEAEPIKLEFAAEMRRVRPGPQP